MFIFYDPATLAVSHTLTGFSQIVTDFNRTMPNQVETAENIPVDEIYLTRAADNSIVVSRLTPFSSDLVAPIGATVNQSLVFKPIPLGTAISINGASLGVMDSTGELDFTPQNGGQYVITLTLTGYKQKDITFEVVA